jgi:hypothetical protein
MRIRSNIYSEYDVQVPRLPSIAFSTCTYVNKNPMYNQCTANKRTTNSFLFVLLHSWHFMRDYTKFSQSPILVHSSCLPLSKHWSRCVGQKWSSGFRCDRFSRLCPPRSYCSLPRQTTPVQGGHQTHDDGAPRRLDFSPIPMYSSAIVRTPRSWQPSVTAKTVHSLCMRIQILHIQHHRFQRLETSVSVLK